MKDWQKRIFEVSKKVSGDQIPVYGAQASFFIVVSVIPFAMALVSLIQFFIPASKILASNGFYWFKWLIPLTYASVMLSRIERYFSLRRSISSIFFRKSRFFVYAIKKLSLLKNG